MTERGAKEAADRARARRRAAGLVAQYIHELSQRHAVVRERSEQLRPQEARP
jgi:hypothetical protein